MKKYIKQILTSSTSYLYKQFQLLWESWQKWFFALCEAGLVKYLAAQVALSFFGVLILTGGAQVFVAIFPLWLTLFVFIRIGLCLLLGILFLLTPINKPNKAKNILSLLCLLEVILPFFIFKMFCQFLRSTQNFILKG